MSCWVPSVEELPIFVRIVSLRKVFCKEYGRERKGY